MSDKAPLVAEETLGRVVKAAGELSLPGFSLYLDRQIGDGALHTVVSLAAMSLLGPLGYVLVGADSFTKSVSGKSLIDTVAGKRPEASTPATRKNA